MKISDSDSSRSSDNQSADFPGCFPSGFLLFQRLFCHLLVQARLWAGRGEGSGVAQGTLGGIPVHWGQRMGPNLQELGRPPPGGVSAPERGGRVCVGCRGWVERWAGTPLWGHDSSPG